jgi:hypothetical protein
VVLLPSFLLTFLSLLLGLFLSLLLLYYSLSFSLPPLPSTLLPVFFFFFLNLTQKKRNFHKIYTRKVKISKNFPINNKCPPMNTEGGWSSFEQCPGSRALHAVVKIGWVFFKLWEGFEKEEMHGV